MWGMPQSKNIYKKNSMQTKIRCGWCEKDDLYRDYHDNEWGNPVYDDATLFEFLLLETFQAGLSWYTILKNDPISKSAFDHFDYKKIARYDQKKIDALMQDAGIIRNSLKIKGTVANAIAFMEVQKSSAVSPNTSGDS
jgi:DNA-3-methyladenine glycosylase I